MESKKGVRCHVSKVPAPSFDIKIFKKSIRYPTLTSTSIYQTPTDDYLGKPIQRAIKCFGRSLSKPFLNLRATKQEEN